MNSRLAPGSPAPSSPAPRYGGLDWLRAGASLAVVVLHAGIPYMSSPMPGLVWCTTDLPAQSVLVDGLCWGIDTFVMPLFFLIGGFLAGRSWLLQDGRLLAVERGDPLRALAARSLDGRIGSVLADGDDVWLGLEDRIVRVAASDFAS